MNGNAIEMDSLRAAIRELTRADERDRVALLLAEWGAAAHDRQAVAAEAESLVSQVRRERSGASGVDQLMHEFSLSSQEGVALMCLAEALLRIPDKATVDRLIRDKIGHGDWQSHLGGSSSLFVNAATWGLMLTGKLVATHNYGLLGGALTRLLAKGGEPLIRRGVDFVMRLLGQQFVMGENIGAALARSRDNEARGYRHSFDMLGEAALTADDAERYFAAYEAAIHAIGSASAGRGPLAGPGISIKLSALHPRYQRSQRQRVMDELLPRLQQLMRLARGYDIGVNIDAEESERLELSLDLFAELAADPALAGWQGLGFVVQAYQKRCPAVIDWLIALARQHRRRFMLRLVKGAYWDSEIKRAQAEGQAGYPVYTHKSHSDLAYLVCAGRLLAAPDAIYPQFATHNAHTLASVRQMARAAGVEAYEFQCLHGMGETLYDHVVGGEGHQSGRPCRIYAPVGSHETLLPYLVRRLLENGANSSFVNRIVDDQVSIASLCEDPAQLIAREGGGPHPAIPLPVALYGPSRRNSAGMDLNDEATLAGLQRRFNELAGSVWQAAPMAVGASGDGARLPVRNPARREEIVGEVQEADAATIAPALAAAEAAAAGWFATPPEQRAAILQRAAGQLEAEREALMALCVREAGKTWSNALAEVREAVDFCHYYGQQLQSGHFAGSEAPGPVVCISPWNFPLAIFVGQVSAALAAGSPVLAKPAEQTPLIAAQAVRLLHAAGVPPAVLQLLPGRGETVGAALVADARVRGVLFTGSTEVARLINRQIASRPGVRLIAETGGQNAMIIDSSALPEQVVQDVLASGFDSAGQRCSALRLLCLQEDIAGRVIALLRAAMGEWQVGDPAELTTDVGPVIDEEARVRLLAHIDAMRARGREVYQLPLPAACDAGCFVPPTLILVDSPGELTQEVFGPVVHVLRFAGDRLPQLVEQINALGYGLTLGLHSRIDETVVLVREMAQVGNLYVNRNMVGAVVGVQPFGGEGLSGTGPKAGGPLYLHRLAGTPQVQPGWLGCHEGDALRDPQSPFRGFAEWAFASGRRELAHRCTAFAEASLLSSHLLLPGPTGERNELRFVPRGRLLCLGPTEDDWLVQIAAVLVTGNTIALPLQADASALAALLPAALQPQIVWLAAGKFSGVVGVMTAAAAATQVDSLLAAEPAALIPVFRPDPVDGSYPLYRLLHERVVSINTAAAGGNTALMTLGG